MSFRQDDIHPCAVCNRGLMHAGMPLFYRIRVERFGFDARAIERQVGLEMMIGNAVLARSLSPNDQIATPMMEPRTVLVCETCSQDHPDLMMLFLGE